MTNSFKSKLLILILMLFPFIQSCTEVKTFISKSPAKLSTPDDNSSKESINTAKKSVNITKKSTNTPKESINTTKKPISTSKDSVNTTAQAADPAQKYMEADQFQKAIDIYIVEHRKYPQDRVLVSQYVKSIEKIKFDADMALDREDFASAGRRYDVLLKNYAHFKKFEKKLSFNESHLNKKFCYCKKTLFKQGFQEYRKGNLSGAIALWQDLFAIDPQYSDIKELLRTAKLQRKNLQEDE